jgi:LacI family transcriptional regulator
MAANLSGRSKPNIRMVAERAQLSPTTVSLALRGDNSIPHETRERVLVAARELNYVHTPRPTRLEQPAIRRLVFVMPDFGDQPVTSNPFFGEVLRGAEQACGEQNASLTFTVVPYDSAPSISLASALYDGHLAGLLLVGPYPPALVERIAAEVKRPIVLIDNALPGQPYDSVMADDFGGGLLATQHLVSLHHTHIAMITSTIMVPSFAERYRGYYVACTGAGLQPLEPSEVTWERPVIAAAVERVLAQTPQPTALFCASDLHAVLVMEALHDLGKQVPNDISIVGFDDLASTRLVRPALTMIHNHPRLLGRVGVQRLLARINGDRQPTQGITIGTRLVIRDSTQRLKPR